MDWPWSPFLHGDGGCSWQGTPKEQTPKTSTPEFLGNWNGKWRITKTLGCPFLPVWMQRGSCSCFGKPGCGDSEFLSLNWWPWAQHLKNCCKFTLWMRVHLGIFVSLFYFTLLYFTLFYLFHFFKFPFISFYFNFYFMYLFYYFYVFYSYFIVLYFIVFILFLF